MRLVSLLVALLVTLSLTDTKAADPLDVSMVALLGNSQKYHGKFVRVIGFLSLDFEGTALWLHKEDYVKNLRKNAVELELPFARKRDPRQDHYVIIEGVFDASKMGHMSMFSGTVKNVSRVELWK